MREDNMGFEWSSLIQPAVDIGSTILGGKYAGADSKRQAELEREAMEMERQIREKELAEGGRQFDLSYGFRTQRQDALQKAYYDMKAKGGEVSGAGEGAFMSSVNTPSAQLEQQEQDILTGQAKSMNQASGRIQADLAQQGVRGGQAATQLRRGIGEMGIQGQKDINKLRYEDEQRRQSQLRAYQASKAQAGYGAQLRPASF